MAVGVGKRTEGRTEISLDYFIFTQKPKIFNREATSDVVWPKIKI